MVWEAVGGFVSGLFREANVLIDQFHLSPEEKAKVKQAMFDAQVKARNDLFALEDSDRDSARKREMALGDPTTRRLAYVYTGGYFGAFMALLMGWVEVQESMKGLVDVLMGVLTAGQYSIMSYYFGSSHGSQQKDKVLDRVVNHKDQGNG
jgi:hypothetical protein